MKATTHLFGALALACLFVVINEVYDTSFKGRWLQAACLLLLMKVTTHLFDRWLQAACLLSLMKATTHLLRGAGFSLLVLILVFLCVGLYVALLRSAWRIAVCDDSHTGRLKPAPRILDFV